MASTSRLYNALNKFLRQCDIVWRDARHLQTLCWMIIGMIESQNVHLNGFGVYVVIPFLRKLALIKGAA